MRSSHLLDRSRTALVLIDVQERYRTVLHDWDRVTTACDLMLRGAQLLGLPIVVTEQYPQGLGHTARELARHFTREVRLVEKRSLSCCGASEFVAALSALARPQVLVAGIETHACVNQTVHDLLAAGYQVHVAEDATSSRLARDVGSAWRKMIAAGMLPTTSEQSLLELVETAGAPEFRNLQSMLKDTRRWQ